MSSGAPYDYRYIRKSDEAPAAYAAIDHRSARARREHVIHQMRGAFRHTAPTTARTKPPPLARERHESIEAASRAPQPREAAGQAAQRRKSRNSCSTNRGSPSPSPTRGLRAKRFEIIADHLVQHALRGRARLIHRPRRRHTLPRAEGMPPQRLTEDRMFFSRRGTSPHRAAEGVAQSWLVRLA